MSLIGPLPAVVVLVLGAAVVLVLVGPISSRPTLATVAGLPFAIIALILGLLGPPPQSLAVAALCAVCVLALLALPALQAEVPAHVAESAALLLLAAGGAIGLANASDLVQTVVGLETLALAAVVLVAIGAGDAALEAAFKYLVLGAISLAGLLFGIGLIYLSTGAFAFPTAAQVGSNPVTLAGVVMVGLGLAFELALVPFHWGALDAYTAAAPSLAGFVMSASKLGAAFALGRLVVGAGAPLSQVLVWIGCLTIIWGTFGAIAQSGTIWPRTTEPAPADNLRRMLAYSAITHAGFIGLALGCLPNGPTTAVFYAAVYGSMAMLVFAALAGLPQAPDLRTLGPLRAVALGLGLFSLSGIPPTPGFWAKLAVLVVAWQSAGPLATLIAVAGGVFSVLYYLRPLPDLFAALRASVPTARAGAMPGVVLATLTVALISLFPGLVWALAR